MRIEVEKDLETKKKKAVRKKDNKEKTNEDHAASKKCKIK